MKTHVTLIAAIVVACGLAAPAEAQLELVRGNPIQEYVSPVILESPVDLWNNDKWTSNEFRAFKCEGVVIDRLVVTREFNKKRTEATFTFDLALANNAPAGKRSATIRVEFVNDSKKLKFRKSGNFVESVVFSHTMDSGGTRSEKQKMPVSAADVQDVFSGTNPRIVISLNVSQN